MTFASEIVDFNGKSPIFFWKNRSHSPLKNFYVEPESYSNPFAAEIEARRHVRDPHYQDDFLENTEKP